MTAPAAELSSVTKVFGSLKALDEVSFTVQPGEVRGFLGPNGAGKSTAVRHLLGLMRPDSGEVRMFGGDAFRDAATLHQRCAYVPAEVTLWPNLTGGACIDLLTASHGQNTERRRTELLERFELDPTKKARTYSTGNRQKVVLVAALCLNVDLLVLDEPTGGLDPLMESVFQRIVKERSQTGCAVLLSSHILAEVEALADSVTVINTGRIVRSATMSQLRQETGNHVLAHVVQPVTAADLGVPADITPAEDGVSVRCRVDPQHLDQTMGALHRAGLQSLIVSPPSLEDMFEGLYSSGAAQAFATSMSDAPASDGGDT